MPGTKSNKILSEKKVNVARKKEEKNKPFGFDDDVTKDTWETFQTQLQKTLIQENIYVISSPPIHSKCGWAD